MTRGLIYLAGPITGLSYGAATDWRFTASSILESVGITPLNPMRGKEILKGMTSLLPGDYGQTICTNKAIITRDRFDVSHCDVILINLLDARTISIGTMIEIGWADAYRKPIVLVIEGESNPHWHCMVREAAGYIVPTLSEALHIISLLVPPGRND